MRDLILLGLLIGVCMSISLPMINNANRCMIVYVSTSDENLILDMKFPPIPDKKEGEFYRFFIYNTEEKTTKQQRVNPGVFRKQLALVESVVYKVCFSLITTRNVGTTIIEYNAETRFSHQIETVKIPQTLLKTQDFQNTYAFAENMHSLTKISLQFQKDRRSREDSIYAENKANVDTLFWISLFEIGVIMVTGGYQFFSVKRFLESKQYL